MAQNEHRVIWYGSFKGGTGVLVEAKEPLKKYKKNSNHTLEMSKTPNIEWVQSLKIRQKLLKKCGRRYLLHRHNGSKILQTVETAMPWAS